MRLVRPKFGVQLNLSARHSPRVRGSELNAAVRATARAQQRLANGLVYSDVPFDGGSPQWRGIYKYHHEFHNLTGFRSKVRAYKWHLDAPARFEAALESLLRGTYFRLPDTSSEFGRRVQNIVHESGGIDRYVNLALFLRAHKRSQYLPPRLNPNFVAPSVVQQSIAAGREAPVDRADLWQAERRRSLTETPRWKAAERQRFLSERPRHPSPVPIVYSKDDAVAYSATQGLRHHADVLSVLMEAQRRLPGWRPRSLLDFGSGSGAAVWAAQGVYGRSEYKHLFVHFAPSPIVDTRPPDGSIDTITCIEPSGAFRDVGAKVLTGMPVAFRKFLPSVRGNIRATPSAAAAAAGLADAGTRAGVHPATAANAGFEDEDDALRGYDLVTCCHTLGELSSNRLRREALQELWRRTQGMLVVVEWGTKRGYENVMLARDLLLREREALGADHPDAPTIIAPCPHHRPCPLAGTAVHCHFRTLATRSHEMKDVFTMDTGNALGLRVESTFERDRAPITYLVAVRNGIRRPDVTSVLPEELRRAFSGDLKEREMKHREGATMRSYATMDGRHVEARVLHSMLNDEAAIAQDSGTFARVLKNTKRGKAAGTAVVSLCTPLGDAVALTLDRKDYADGKLRGWRLAHKVGYARGLIPLKEIAPTAWETAKDLRRKYRAPVKKDDYSKPEEAMPEQPAE